ncbi:MAG: hypothetical protein AB7W16_12175 [Candidatus Obscuribacterales bacterium]
MQQSLLAFAEGKHSDPADALAQRAVLAMLKLRGLVGNAYQRGDGEGYVACNQAVRLAVAGFAVVNQAKHYPFAGEIGELQDIRLTGIIDDTIGAAAPLVEDAEVAFDLYRERCAPTYGIFGVTSVTILRGDHCRAATAEMVALNDN